MAANLELLAAQLALSSQREKVREAVVDIRRLAQYASQNNILVVPQSSPYTRKVTYPELMTDIAQQIQEGEDGQEVRQTIHTALLEQAQTLGKRTVPERIQTLAKKSVMRRKEVLNVAKRILQTSIATDDTQERENIRNLFLTPQTEALLLDERVQEKFSQGKTREVLYLFAQGARVEEIASLYRRSVPFIKSQLKKFQTFYDKKQVSQALAPLYDSVKNDAHITFEDFPKLPHQDILISLSDMNTPTYKLAEQHDQTVDTITKSVIAICITMYRAGLSVEDIQESFPQLFRDDFSLPLAYFDYSIEQELPPKLVASLCTLYTEGTISNREKEQEGTILSDLRECIKTVEGIDDVTLFVRFPILLPLSNVRIDKYSLMSSIQENWMDILQQPESSIEDMLDDARKHTISPQHAQQQVTNVVHRYMHYGRLHELSFLKKLPQFTKLFSAYENAYAAMDLLLRKDPPESPTYIYQQLRGNKELSLTEESCARWILHWQKT